MQSAERPDLRPTLPGEGPPDTAAFDSEVKAALERIADPCSIATGVPINIVDMGLVLVAQRNGRSARVVVQLTSPICMQIGMIAAKVQETVGALEGIDNVAVDIDHGAEWLPTMMAAPARNALRQRRPF